MITLSEGDSLRPSLQIANPLSAEFARSGPDPVGNYDEAIPYHKMHAWITETLGVN